MDSGNAAQVAGYCIQNSNFGNTLSAAAAFFPKYLTQYVDQSFLSARWYPEERADITEYYFNS